MGDAGHQRALERHSVDNEAEKLAEQIANFPQICLQHDRLSAYEQYDYNFEDALKNEYNHGLKSLSEVQDGLHRFNKGEGRHGKF